MKTRKIVAMVAVLLTAVLVFTACGGGQTPAPSASQSAAAESQAPAKTDGADAQASDAGAAKDGKKFKVGYVNKTLNNPYFVALDAALKAEVEAMGWEYASLDAKEDIAQEQKNMETFVSQGYDLIVMNCIDSKACLPAIKSAMDAGVPVINVDNSPDISANNITTVCSDNLRNGHAVGLYVGKEMFKPDEKITSVLLSGVKGAVVSQERRTGLMAGIIEARSGCTEEEAWEKAKAMEQELTDKGKAVNEEANFAINGQGWGNWTSDEGLPAMEDLIVANKDMNLVLGENDNMLLGAMKAIENAGLSDKIQIAAAADGQKEAIKLILDGTNYKATGENNPYVVAKMAIEIGNDVLMNGKTPDDYERVTRTPANCITNENATEFYKEDSLF